MKPGSVWHRIAENDGRSVRFGCEPGIAYPVSRARLSTGEPSCRRPGCAKPPAEATLEDVAPPSSSPRTIRCKRVEYGPRVDAILEGVPFDFTTAEYVAAAMALLDQAGVSPESQRRIGVAVLAVIEGGAS